MKLIDSIYESVHKYPSLFYLKDHPTRSDFEISRLAVLEHLFLVGGNGYCWVDGYLCDMEHAGGEIDFIYPGLGYTATKPKYKVLKYKDRTWPPKRTYRNLAHKMEMERDMRVIFRDDYKPEPTPDYDMFAYEYVKSWGRPLEFPFSIYYTELPFPEYVQRDWMEGARDIVQFAITFFESPSGLDGNNSKIPIKNRHDSLIELREKLSEINTRLKKEGQTV